MEDIDPETGFHWQSRRIGYSRPDDQNRQITILLKRLAELQARTDPRKGAESSKGKDIDAKSALTLAGQLVDAVAGWAIDHQVGLGLNGLAFVPLYNPEVRLLPSHISERAEVDDHAHEARGTEQRLKPIPELAKRQIAINLLLANPGAFPADVATSLREGLAALDQNETLPILQKTGKWKKKGLSETKLMLRALAFVSFRSASKLMSAGEAHQEVADAYGVPFETLRGWEKWLRDNVGQTQVAAARRRAKNAGGTFAGQSVRSAALARLEGDGEFGSDALATAGEDYKRRSWLADDPA